MINSPEAEPTGRQGGTRPSYYLAPEYGVGLKSEILEELGYRRIETPNGDYLEPILGTEPAQPQPNSQSETDTEHQ